jgi:hypothetical protein
MNHTQPIGRLRLEPLEDRTVPTGSEGIIGPVPVPTYSVGAGAGGLPIAKLYDTVGNLVREVIAFDPSFHGGVRVATADINGDLIKDTIAAPGPGMPPEIRVFSGANGALIRQFFAYAPVRAANQRCEWPTESACGHRASRRRPCRARHCRRRHPESVSAS